MSTRVTTGFFDTQADAWGTLYTRKSAFRDRLALFTDAVRRHLPRSARVLDLGCGSGNIACSLARLGYDVTGLDGSPEMIAVARRAADAEKLRVTFSVQAAEGLSVPDASFDAVVCSSVMEYIAQDDLVLARLAAALVAGGFLFVSVPHTRSVVGRLEDQLRRLPSYTRRTRHQHLVYSLRRYDLHRLEQTFEALGLAVAQRTFFEGPVPGRIGVRLSRHPMIGRMALLVGRKDTLADRQ